jgi:hypothetical protein
MRGGRETESFQRALTILTSFIGFGNEFSAPIVSSQTYADFFADITTILALDASYIR